MPRGSRPRVRHWHRTACSEVAQFDLYRLGDALLVVDLQTDLLDLTATRLVAPLRPVADAVALPGLTPEVDWADARHRVMIPEMAAVAGASMGRRVGAIPQARDALMRAVDILLQGV